MAEIKSPLAGSIVNINASTVSREVISGGGGGKGSDPKTSAIVKREATDIVTINKTIGILAKRQSDSIVAFQQLIGNLTVGLKNIQVTVVDLGNKLNITNNLLTAETKLEQQEKLQEQDQEKKLAEQGARAEKESLLERKIQSALLAPVRAIQAATQSIFERLTKFFGILLAGWLTNQLIETLKANAQGNKTKLQQIFDAVIVALSTTFKGLSLISRTFGFITKIIFGVTKLVAKLTAGLITGLFKGVKNLGQLAIDGAKGLFGMGAKAAVKPGTEAAVKTAEKAAGKGIIKGTAGKVPLLSIGTGIVFGGMRLMEGDVTGAGMEAASALAATVPGWGTWASYTIDASIVARDVGAFKGTAFGKNEPGVNPPAAPTKPQAKSQVKVNPSAKIKPVPPKSTEQPPATPPAADTSPANPDTSTQLQPAQVQTKSSSISTLNLGPVPEPQPNVVMMPSPSTGGNQGPQMTSTGGEASDVPAISSSNIDNFYTLYSQINYNVVM